MPTITRTIQVRRPREEVFEYLSQVAKHAEWSPKGFWVEGDVTTLAPGARFTSHGWVPGNKDHRNDVEVTEFSRPSRIAWAATGTEGRFLNDYILTEENGTTTIERIFVIPEQSGFHRVLFPLISAMIINPSLVKGLEMLKSRLETTTAAV